ncbi:MAG: hypothetical protein AAFR21_08730 [Pseudomonadota bacterium]
MSASVTDYFRKISFGLVAILAAGAALAISGKASANDARYASGATIAVSANGGYYGARYHRGRFHGNRRFYGPRYYGSRYYGPRYRGRYFRGGGYYGPRHFRGRGYYGRRYRGPRYFGRGYYHRRGLSGGEVALIATGIIGGAILIDRALEDRYARDRYDDRRYVRDDVRRRGPWDDEYYYQRDDRFAERAPERLTPDGDDLRDRNQGYDEGFNDPGANGQRESDDDFGLLGGNADRGPDQGAVQGDDFDRGAVRPGVVTASYPSASYRECAAETRGAVGAGGMQIAMPGEPTKVERLEGGTYRLTAVFTAQNPRGETWRRVMICEADDAGIAFLEIA